MKPPEAVARLQDLLAKALEHGVRDLEKSIYTDDKTPLLNAAAYTRYAPEWVAKTDQARLVAFGDLNSFKSLNDRHGHEAGDSAIHEVGKLIHGFEPQSSFRRSGDEFVILLPRDRKGEFIEFVRSKLARVELVYSGTQVVTSMSAGIVEATEQPFEELMRRAETACLVAKDQGAGATVEWTAEHDANAPADRRFRCPDCSTKVTCVLPRSRAHEELKCPLCGRPIREP